jgi:hypothetical protein
MMAGIPHDPRSSPISQNINWKEAEWNGIPYNYIGKTKAEIHAFLRPGYPANKLAIRGLEQRFYEVQPFADNYNPTVKEIDTWNLEVIRHIRRVLGVTIQSGPLLGQPVPILPDPRLYIEAAWADERKHTQKWDVKYPDGVIHNGIEYFGWAPGPCYIPGSNPPQKPTPYNAHCGASFTPHGADAHLYRTSAPYFYDLTKYPELGVHGHKASFVEGLSGTGTDVPWSLRLAVIIANFIMSEGTSGHAGPFFSRPWVGMSWKCDENGKSLAFRGKWNGRIRTDNGAIDRPYLGVTKP